jgi:predicted dithiol-disulfide oxidoreductase (DUF899 family)
MTNDADHPLAARDEWLRQRLALLEAEKAHTRRADMLVAQRQALPWVLMEEGYRFADATGEHALAELFDGRRQLAMYHFMFGPDWDEGCERCSFFADQFDGIRLHLAQRDTTLVAVSNTAPEKIDAYRQRMGWSFPWFSSLGTSFNGDFNTTLAATEIETGDAYYNYKKQHFFWTEAQGMSVFVLLDDGRVAHAYSTFGRGIDTFNAAYAILDLTPKGRDEVYPFDWLRRRDEYETDGRTA